MTLTPAQVKVFQKGLAAVNAVLTKIQFLQGLAEASPELAEQMPEILSQHEFLQTLSSLALQLDEAERSGEQG